MLVSSVVGKEVCFVTICDKHRPALATFFEMLHANGDAEFFHPHGLDAEASQQFALLSERGCDEYWIAVRGEDVLA